MVALLSLVFLAALGAVSTKAGGNPVLKATLRVTFWGAIAMLATALAGLDFGISV
jgi:VIT1/CCC1 family predicted Fe2+/Mn2+ transporter